MQERGWEADKEAGGLRPHLGAANRVDVLDHKSSAVLSIFAFAAGVDRALVDPPIVGENVGAVDQRQIVAGIPAVGCVGDAKLAREFTILVSLFDRVHHLVMLVHH